MHLRLHLIIRKFAILQFGQYAADCRDRVGDPVENDIEIKREYVSMLRKTDLSAYHAFYEQYVVH